MTEQKQNQSLSPNPKPRKKRDKGEMLKSLQRARAARARKKQEVLKRLREAGIEIPSQPPDSPQENKQEESISPELPQETVPVKLPPEVAPSVFEMDDFLGVPVEVIAPRDIEREKFKEFLNTQWGLPAAVVMFRGLFGGGYPPLPPPNRWDVPSDVDVVKLVWEQTQTESFINEAWPSIRMILRDDIANFQWAAQVATVLAFFNIIKILPIVLEDEALKEQPNGKES